MRDRGCVPVTETCALLILGICLVAAFAVGWAFGGEKN